MKIILCMTIKIAFYAYVVVTRVRGKYGAIG